MTRVNTIAVGDTIHHTYVPPGLLDVTVLAMKPCDDDMNYATDHIGDHPRYLIKDPESGEPDWVCSRDFVKVVS